MGKGVSSLETIPIHNFEEHCFFVVKGGTREGSMRYNLHPKKKEGVLGFDGGTKGGLGLNEDKGFKGVSRGRKYFMSLALEKSINEV